MAERPAITLESIKLKSFSDLYAMPSKDVVEKLDEVPLHAGDAFLAVVVLRAVGDLAAATKRLEKLTWALVGLSVALVALAIVTALNA
jgi:hypothetical protein